MAVEWTGIVQNDERKWAEFWYGKCGVSPKVVEKSCGKPGEFGKKVVLETVVSELSKCVFHKLWRKSRGKMALFCGLGDETAHFRGCILWCGKFSTDRGRSAMPLSERGTVSHRYVGKGGNREKKWECEIEKST